jgi:ribonuclease BN (tRNA processing enzyme)
MKLVTLGGSAAGPNPGQGCSGYLVSSGQTRIICDLGPGTLTEMRRHVNFREIDAILVSHLHLDHILDLLALRFALAYNPISPSRPVPLWLPPDGRAYFTRLAEVFAEEGAAEDYFSVFEIGEYNPENVLDIGDLQIRFHPTAHFVPCWAMRISNSVDGDLFYTADTGPTAPLSSFANGVFVVVAEGTETDPADGSPADRGHLTPEEAGTLATQAQAEVLVLTHVWTENNPFAAVRSAEVAFTGPVMLATPGLTLEWSSRTIEGADRQC